MTNVTLCKLLDYLLFTITVEGENKNIQTGTFACDRVIFLDWQTFHFI